MTGSNFLQHLKRRFSSRVITFKSWSWSRCAWTFVPQAPMGQRLDWTLTGVLDEFNTECDWMLCLSHVRIESFQDYLVELITFLTTSTTRIPDMSNKPHQFCTMLCGVHPRKECHKFQYWSIILKTCKKGKLRCARCVILVPITTKLNVCPHTPIITKWWEKFNTWQKNGILLKDHLTKLKNIMYRHLIPIY